MNISCIEKRERKKKARGEKRRKKRSELMGDDSSAAGSGRDDKVSAAASRSWPLKRATIFEDEGRGGRKEGRREIENAVDWPREGASDREERGK